MSDATFLFGSEDWFLAPLLTFAVAFVMLHNWYELSRTFIGQAQKISAALPILAVTEGQVAQKTNERRRTESFKGEGGQPTQKSVTQASLAR